MRIASPLVGSSARALALAALALLGTSYATKHVSAQSQVPSTLASIDSIVLDLHERQVVRLRLADGTRRQSSISKIDSHPSALRLRDNRPPVLASAIVSLTLKTGTHAKPVAIGVGTTFAFLFGAAGAATPCANGRGCRNTGAAVGNGLVGVTIGAITGGLIGAWIGHSIPRWTLQYQRAPAK